MKKYKLTKTLGLGVIPILAISFIAPTVCMTFNRKTNNVSEITKVPLSNVIDPNTYIGTFNQKPNAEALLASAKIEVSSFHNEGSDWFDVTINNPTITVGTAIITPRAACPYYTTDSVVVTWTFDSTATHNLRDYFGGNAVYNITSTTTSGNAVYFPSNATTLTEKLLIKGLSGMHTTALTDFLNLNQLEVRDGDSGITWDATNDYYTALIEPVSNSNFYSSTNASVTIHFNKERTDIGGNFLTDKDINDYHYIPTGGLDGDALWYKLNLDNTDSNQASMFSSFSSSGAVEWANLSSRTPSFTVKGNETYTNKNGANQQTNTPITLTMSNVPKINLTDFITKYEPTTNLYLVFNTAPKELDIRWAITQGGGASTPLELQWSDITITINNPPLKTATITGKVDSGNYHNLNYYCETENTTGDAIVTVSFQY